MIRYVMSLAGAAGIVMSLTAGLAIAAGPVAICAEADMDCVRPTLETRREPLRVAETQTKDRVIYVPSDDPEMNAAIAKARSTLSEFWKAVEAGNPNESDFALKVMIVDGPEVEHFWLTDVARSGAGYVGTISNDPNSVSNVTARQRYEFSEEEISDWLYFRNGKMVGNETMRPLLKRMPKEQADQYRALYEKP